MAKLKAKIIVLENTEGQKRQYEKRCEEMAARLLEMEKQVSNARKEINHYQVLIVLSNCTVNFLNIRTPKKFVVVTLKFELCGFIIE